MENGLFVPTLADVLNARKIIRRYLKETPLIAPGALAEQLGFEAHVKCENLQPIGAFKIRGALNVVSSLSPEERRRGVVTASTGNHGQAVAYAAGLFGVTAWIYAPEGANPYKVEAMRRLGAQVVLHGRDFDEARAQAEEFASRERRRYIHPANEPLLIAGAGTSTLEIIEELPDVDVIIVPIGGGSQACGACIVAKSIRPSIGVIGVQAQAAPAVYLSWKEGRLTETESARTFADGLATRVAFALPHMILARHLDDMQLVTEEEMRQAVILLLDAVHQLAEGAGAASTAAAVKLRDSLRGKKVAIVLSGGNITLDMLRRVLQGPMA